MALRIADARGAERLRRNPPAEGSLDGQECRSSSLLAEASARAADLASWQPQLAKPDNNDPALPRHTGRFAETRVPHCCLGSLSATTPTLPLLRMAGLARRCSPGRRSRSTAGRSRCQLAAVEGPGHAPTHVCGEPRSRPGIPLHIATEQEPREARSLSGFRWCPVADGAPENPRRAHGLSLIHI